MYDRTRLVNIGRPRYINAGTGLVHTGSCDMGGDDYIVGRIVN